MINNNVDTEFLLLKHIARIAKFVKVGIFPKLIFYIDWPSKFTLF